MKWSFVIQQKLKATLLLGGIMVVIVSGTIVSRRNINGIDRSAECCVGLSLAF